MAEQSSLDWSAGASDAPLPPLADFASVSQAEHPFVELYRAYGPVFRLPQSGKEPRVILAGAEANVFMARHEDEFFTTREHWQQFDANITQKQNTMSDARDGEANRKRRASSSRQWSRARILDQIPLMMEISRECTASWEMGSNLPVHASMRRLVAEQLGGLLLGYRPGEYLDDFVTFLNTTLTSTLGKDTPQTERLNSPEYQHAVARVNEFGRKAYEFHLEHPQPTGKADMLDEAIQASEGMPEELRRGMLEKVALGPMLAGIDTVANSLSFMLYALLAHREIHQRVQAEVDAALSTGPLDWDKLKQMPDLNGVMMETLRLYPVASGHNARVAQPLTIGGYRLEPGSEVFVAMTVPHFLAELYPQPTQFDIERFREPRNEHRQRGAYAPFGLGNHTCLGSGIAEVQLMITMATLLSQYSFEFVPSDYRLVIEYHPTAVPGNNFRVRVAARANAPALA